MVGVNTIAETAFLIYERFVLNSLRSLLRHNIGRSVFFVIVNPSLSHFILVVTDGGFLCAIHLAQTFSLININDKSMAIKYTFSIWNSLTWMEKVSTCWKGGLSNIKKLLLNIWAIDLNACCLINHTIHDYIPSTFADFWSWGLQADVHFSTTLSHFCFMPIQA